MNIKMNIPTIPTNAIKSAVSIVGVILYSLNYETRLF